MKSLVFSIVVSSATAYVGWELLLYYLYEPLTVAAVVAILVALFRFRSLRSGMPAPFGLGRASVIDEKATARSGFLLVLGGIISVVGLMGSVFFIPPELYFVLLLGIIAGLPLSVIVFFALVAFVEARSSSRIYLVAEEATKEGETVLVKTVEMVTKIHGG